MSRWSCDERAGRNCRNPHGCHCKEIDALRKAVDARTRTPPLPDDVAAALEELENDAEHKQAGGALVVVKDADLRLLIDHVRKGG